MRELGDCTPPFFTSLSQWRDGPCLYGWRSCLLSSAGLDHITSVRNMKHRITKYQTKLTIGILQEVAAPCLRLDVHLIRKNCTFAMKRVVSFHWQIPTIKHTKRRGKNTSILVGAPITSTVRWNTVLPPRRSAKCRKMVPWNACHTRDAPTSLPYFGQRASFTLA